MNGSAVSKLHLHMFYMTDVVKNLLILNVICYVVTHLTGSWGEEVLYQTSVYFLNSEYFRPFQIVTYMFMHGNFMHIFFNMFGLVMFGSAMEAAWGPKRFLFYYLFTGLGALALQWIVLLFQFPGGVPTEVADIPMLGASGAIFGLLAAYGLTFPNSIIQMMFPPIAMKAKYFVLLYAAAELYMGLNPNTMPGVAHFAHLGGALFGLLLILFWRKRGERLS